MVSKDITPPNRGVKSLRDPGEDAVTSGKDLNPDLAQPAEDDNPTRASAAVTLRIAGASYSDIKETLGYSSAYRARTAVERALAEDGGTPEERAVQRRIIDRRLNRLLQSVMGRAVNTQDPDQLAYNRQALAIVDRQARLHGVDAPATAVVYSPKAEQVQEYIGHILALHQQATSQEADIVDAEIEEMDS